MDLVMTGTGSPIPDPNRAGPSQLVVAAGRHLLVDAGRGCLMRLAAAGSGAGALDRVLLTHLHSDHLTDFNDVITSRWIGGFPPAPLDVVGPVGTERLVGDTLAMLGPDIGYRIAHHEDLESGPEVRVQETSGGLVHEDDEVRITSAPTEHRPVHPTVAYRIDADGGSVVLAGDTVPCAGLDELCVGADVYVQTVVRDDAIRQVAIPRLMDVLDYHSTIADAAETAARAGVGTLVLNHVVPAPAPGQEEELVGRAAEHFDGRILLPADLERIAVSVA